MEQTIELKPEQKQLIKRAEDLSGEMQTFVVASQSDFDKAGMFLINIKEQYKILEEERFSITRPVNESINKIIALFAVPLNKLSKAKSILSGARIKYQQIQEDKRRQEEARLADLQRKEAERLAKLAEKAEKKGNHEKAGELIQQAQEKEAIKPIVPIQVQKTKGIKMRKDWKFEIIDATAIPREYMIPDEKTIGAIVRATKGTKTIPGVRIYKKISEAV